MYKIRRICVYCGSGIGADSAFVNAANKLGKVLVDNNIELVYGGASVGLMGTIAKSVLENGGKVIGIIPKSLVGKEVALTELTDLRIVNTMHERKILMTELSDGFIAMPGGFGTLEEIFEIITWAQLGFHNKPCSLLNINGYYDHLLKFLDHTVDQHFIEKEHYKMVIVDTYPELIISKFKKYSAPNIDKAKWALNNKILL